ncbi:MAG: SURF1 family protein, partial [Gammaproteobacteria bacterium]|nr:SURF1 family protein [Gammaproteobacteria bacterium]
MAIFLQNSVLVILLQCKRQWRMTLLVLSFLPLLVGLGLWQLFRAEEKRTLLLNYQRLQLQPTVNLNLLKEEQWTDYLPVHLHGKFDGKRYWLLDNRSRNGFTGYEIVVPFATDEYIVLVNIGWVRSSPERSRLPV